MATIVGLTHDHSLSHLPSSMAFCSFIFFSNYYLFICFLGFCVLFFGFQLVRHHMGFQSLIRESRKALFKFEFLSELEMKPCMLLLFFFFFFNLIFVDGIGYGNQPMQRICSLLWYLHLISHTCGPIIIMLHGMLIPCFICMLYALFYLHAISCLNHFKYCNIQWND